MPRAFPRPPQLEASACLGHGPEASFSQELPGVAAGGWGGTPASAALWLEKGGRNLNRTVVLKLNMRGTSEEGRAHLSMC